jgi:hypothetical protein
MFKAEFPNSYLGLVEIWLLAPSVYVLGYVQDLRFWVHQYNHSGWIGSIEL